MVEYALLVVLIAIIALVAVSLAGKNDCATSTNACHGHVEKDASPEAWIYLPKGTCERLNGARVVKVVDPTPKK